MLYNGQDFTGHLQDDRVGVSVRHEAGQGATPGHAIPTAVINNDQVGPSGFFELGRYTGPGPSPDYRAAICDNSL
jgi:hypothetical protein